MRDNRETELTYDPKEKQALDQHVQAIAKICMPMLTKSMTTWGDRGVIRDQL